MSVIVDNFLRNIFSCPCVYKCIFQKFRVINFQIFPLDAHHGGLNLTNLNISSLNLYLLNVGLSAILLLSLMEFLKRVWKTGQKHLKARLLAIKDRQLFRIILFFKLLILSSLCRGSKSSINSLKLIILKALFWVHWNKSRVLLWICPHMRVKKRIINCFEYVNCYLKLARMPLADIC